MTFTINRTELLTALSITGKAVSKTQILPITTCYLFELSKDVLTIATCDLEKSVTYTLPCKGDELCIAIPATVIYNLIKELPDQPLTFFIENNICEIKAVKGKYKIPIEDGSNFPKIAHKSEQVLTIQTDPLFDNIQRTVFAAASGHIIPGLNHMLFKITKKGSNMVSSDGLIMSVRGLDIKGKESDLLITPQSLSVLTSMPYNEQSELSISDNSLQVKVNDNTVFTCVLCGEKYPPYESIIPKHNDKSLTVDTSELTGALKRLQLFASEANNDFIIDMGSAITVSSENLKSERAEEEVTAIYAGEPLQVKMKCGKMLALLSRVKSDFIELTFSEHNKGVILKEPESENLMLIMPIV